MDKLVWIDLETTGLDPRKDRILEVACIVTEGTRELGRFQAVTDAAKRVPFDSLHGAVQEMHTKNGLWAESLMSFDSITTVAERLLAFLMAHTEPGQAQLAGSTISFDRAFLTEWCPQVIKHLHYRNLDVSTLNEVARRWSPAVYESRPRGEKVHRAIADLQNSIDTLSHYLVGWEGQ